MAGEGEDKFNNLPYTNVKAESVQLALEAKFGKDVKLTDFHFKDFTQKGDGYAAITTSIVANYVMDKKDSTTFVIKLNPCRQFSFIDDDIYIKEGRIYLDILSQLDKILVDNNIPPISTPKCYYAQDIQNAQVLFLEDMRHENIRMFDRKKVLDIPHLRLILSELGKFHAASMLFLENRTRNEMYELYPCLKELLYKDKYFSDDHNIGKMFEISNNQAIDIIQSQEGYNDIAEELKKIEYITNIRKLLESKPPLQVICHGDCWTNNFLFRYDNEGNPSQVILLDWQVVRIGSPALDLNYLLFSSTSGDVRAPNLELLLNNYFSSFKSIFTSAGKEIPFQFKDLQNEFKSKNLFGMFSAFMLIPAMLSASEDIPDLESLKEEDVMKMEEEFGGLAKKNPLIKPRMLNLIDELLDNGTINKP